MYLQQRRQPGTDANRPSFESSLLNPESRAVTVGWTADGPPSTSEDVDIKEKGARKKAKKDKKEKKDKQSTSGGGSSSAVERSPSENANHTPSSGGGSRWVHLPSSAVI